MKYVKVAEAASLSVGGKVKLTLEGHEIMLARLDDGYYAISNKCPHMGGSLADGRLEGQNIICPRHGSVFDVKTGKSVQGGKMAFIKFHVDNVTAYPVKTEGADVMVGIE